LPSTVRDIQAELSRTIAPHLTEVVRVFAEANDRLIGPEKPCRRKTATPIHRKSRLTLQHLDVLDHNLLLEIIHPAVKRQRLTGLKAVDSFLIGIIRPGGQPTCAPACVTRTAPAQRPAGVKTAISSPGLSGC